MYKERMVPQYFRCAPSHLNGRLGNKINWPTNASFWYNLNMDFFVRGREAGQWAVKERCLASSQSEIWKQTIFIHVRKIVLHTVEKIWKSLKLPLRIYMSLKTVTSSKGRNLVTTIMWESYNVGCKWPGCENQQM